MLVSVARQVEGGMEQRVEDSSCSVGLSSNTLEKTREDPSGELEGKDLFCESTLTDKQDHGREVEGGAECTTAVVGNGLHPSVAAEVDRSSPAEQHGEDLGPAREKEAKGEEAKSDVEEAEEAMEDEGAEDEEEEKQTEEDSYFCLEAVSVETVVIRAELVDQQLQTDGLTQERLHAESQQSRNTQVPHKSLDCVRKIHILETYPL